MFISPRTYSASQTPDQGLLLAASDNQLRYQSLQGWRADSPVASRTPEMLLIHQAGSVRVGEVVRSVVSPHPPPPSSILIRNPVFKVIHTDPPIQLDTR